MAKNDRAMEENSFVYSNDNEGGDVEVLFLPYIDDNEIWISYHELNNKNYKYPTVDFSTFVDEIHEHILVQIKNKFLLFSKFGNFLYEVYFFDTDDTVIEDFSAD